MTDSDEEDSAESSTDEEEENIAEIAEDRLVTTCPPHKLQYVTTTPVVRLVDLYWNSGWTYVVLVLNI